MNQKTFPRGGSASGRKKQITHWLSVIVIGITLGLALQFVRAWTEPTTSPPNGNVGAPLNTGSTPQTKSGAISSGTSFSAPWIFGMIYSPYICLNGYCIDNWSSSFPPCRCYIQTTIGQNTWACGIQNYKACPAWGWEWYLMSDLYTYDSCNATTYAAQEYPCFF